jgi:glutamate-5-semialdehyde dehydrogenase
LTFPASSGLSSQHEESAVNSHVKPQAASDLVGMMQAMGLKARAAAQVVALASAERKNAALTAAAAAIRNDAEAILSANAEDLAEADRAGVTSAYRDRLALDRIRIESIAQGLIDVAALKDPIGEVTATWSRPNGLRFERVRTPLGVIGIIFESRPNVTADAGALSLKAGNACILRAGSDSLQSSLAIHRCLASGLTQAGLPADAIQLVPVKDRDAVGLMLTGLGGSIDVIVPRGGKSLVARVQSEARVPVFAHLDGNNHVYVHEEADLSMAKTVLLNAKLRRTGVCGAAETLLVDQLIAGTHLQPLLSMLLDAGCAVRGDAAALAADPRVTPASEEDWGTEYLDSIIAVKLVAGPSDAIAHIERYGSHHTDAIITQDEVVAERFLNEVDSAIVLHNASTQFADGGEFGFGAEIGIATGRMHARGPVGVEQLTSFKYKVRGEGTIRP